MQSQVITRTSSPNSVTQTYSYDAAGQRTDAGKYDGDGRRVQAADAKRYDLRSSLLGGRSVTEIYVETDPEALRRGRKATTFVYVEGEAIAEQYLTYVCLQLRRGEHLAACARRSGGGDRSARLRAVAAAAGLLHAALQFLQLWRKQLRL